MESCRGCGAGDLTEILSLGNQPLANSYVRPDDADKPEARYPLRLGFCAACSLTQLMETIEPERLFEDYPYFSSVSDSFVAHAERIARRLIVDRRLTSSSRVIEIASNDGYLLQHYVKEGIEVLGIDPARNVVVKAIERGVPTLPRFFDLELADELLRGGRNADVIHANNVIAHVPDIHPFMEGIARILKPDGIAVFETPYVRDLVDRVEFDTIYHEHVFYWSLTSLAGVLALHGLSVTDVQHLDVHGGSLRVFAQRAGAPAAGTVSKVLADETLAGLSKFRYYAKFGERVRSLKSELRSVLQELKERGQTIAAYGAAAKGTVLLNAFSIDSAIVDFVADRSPYKSGYLMPGVHIPIVPADQLLARHPDVCLLLAWNFADEVLAQQAEYLGQGGQFLVPAPRPTFVPALPALGA